jgi:hypothetical protein
MLRIFLQRYFYSRTVCTYQLAVSISQSLDATVDGPSYKPLALQQFLFNSEKVGPSKVPSKSLYLRLLLLPELTSKTETAPAPTQKK